MATESQPLNIGSQRILAWTGPIALVVFFIGFWPLAGFLPPLHESENSSQIATFSVTIRSAFGAMI